MEGIYEPQIKGKACVLKYGEPCLRPEEIYEANLWIVPMDAFPPREIDIVFDKVDDDIDYANAIVPL
ncbi:hypothetical protein HAX54_050484 [Datura stramonium]|uniref:Uncharacterized protein n=1 Tax=Datura stramonium TaxID=4076 RepID=A0ABS8WNU4_DATST|nr:hypothetical protein [Datura stramonium]